MHLFGNNLLVLLALWILTAIAGAYITFFQQPSELQQVEKARQVAQLKQTEVTSLIAEASSSKQQADEAISKWRARYKTIPQELTSVAVVAYLNNLTRSGFENFDVQLEGINRSPNYQYYSFKVSGRAYYTSLYRFVWDIENNRSFYRIRDLNLEHIDLLSKDDETETERMEVMVAFSMAVDAFFASPEGASATDSSQVSTDGQRALPILPEGTLPPVPASVLPTMRPATNPFFPAILNQLPPNTHGLIDIEKAELVAIVGNKAHFIDEKGNRKAGVGDDVYLGQITAIDAINGTVRARLNKGGIIDEVELKLLTAESYRQALGPVRLTPAAQ